MRRKGVIPTCFVISPFEAEQVTKLITLILSIKFSQGNNNVFDRAVLLKLRDIRRILL